MEIYSKRRSLSDLPSHVFPTDIWDESMNKIYYPSFQPNQSGPTETSQLLPNNSHLAASESHKTTDTVALGGSLTGSEDFRYSEVLSRDLESSAISSEQPTTRQLETRPGENPPFSEMFGQFHVLRWVNHMTYHKSSRCSSTNAITFERLCLIIISVGCSSRCPGTP